MPLDQAQRLSPSPLRVVVDQTQSDRVHRRSLLRSAALVDRMQSAVEHPRSHSLRQVRVRPPRRDLGRRRSRSRSRDQRQERKEAVRRRSPSLLLVAVVRMRLAAEQLRLALPPLAVEGPTRQGAVRRRSRLSFPGLAALMRLGRRLRRSVLRSCPLRRLPYLVQDSNPEQQTTGYMHERLTIDYMPERRRINGD